MDREPAEIADAVQRLLAHDRRRASLEVLSELSAAVELEDLVARVARRESGGLVSPEEKEASVAIALHHAHLPKMDDLGFIEYDPQEARVELCPCETPSTHG